MVDHDELARRLRGAIAGDRSAVAWLYDTFADRLYRRLRGRYGHAVDASDLLQDAFVFYLQHDARVLRRFLDTVPAAERTPPRLERHLWDLACGLASNRRRSRQRGVEVVPLDPEQRSAAPGAERATLDRDLLRRLLACLERAGSRIFLYFQLRFEDGLSPSQIADATGWSRKATYKLRQTLDRAVTVCREELGLDAGTG